MKTPSHMQAYRNHQYLTLLQTSGLLVLFLTGCEFVQTGQNQYALRAKNPGRSDTETSTRQSNLGNHEAYNSERELARSPFWKSPEQRGSWSSERLPDATSHMFVTDAEHKLEIIHKQAYGRGQTAGWHDKTRKAAYNPRGYPSITNQYDAECMKNFLTGYNDAYTFYFPEGTPVTPAP